MQVKKFKEARDHILKSIEYRPDNVQAWLTLAEDYGQLGNTQEEVMGYKRVVEIANADTTNDGEKYSKALQESYRMIGVRMLIDATKDKDPKTNKSKYEAVLPWLLKALQLNPKDCQVLLWVAQTYQNSNNKDEAKRYYRKLLETCPGTKEAEDGKNGLKVLGD